MLGRWARALDELFAAGQGLDAQGDPFGAPLEGKDAEGLLDAVRRARFAGVTPFTSPLPPPGGSIRVPLTLRPPRRGRAWAVLALPYGSFTPRNALGLYEVHARALAAAGFGVAALPLPYHGSRALGAQSSGWGFVRADLGATARAIASASAEVAATARHLRETQGAERVVGFGLSLGGEALGLAAVCGAPFDALALLAAVDNPASFYATGANREARRRTLAAHGIGAAEIARAFAPFAPSSHAPPLPGARLLFAIPEHDAVVPAAAQEAWRRAWDGVRIGLPWHAHATALASPGTAWDVARRLARA